MQYAWYAVASPEACAAILWKNGENADQAAEALKLTSKDLLKLGLVDEVIPEPLGGAHRNVHDTVYNVKRYIVKTLQQLKHIKIDRLIDTRYAKLRSIGTSSTVKAVKDKVRVPVQEIKSKSKRIPAKV